MVFIILVGSGLSGLGILGIALLILPDGFSVFNHEPCALCPAPAFNSTDPMNSIDSKNYSSPCALHLIPFPHPTCLYKILPASLSTGIGNILKTGKDDRVPFLSAEKVFSLKLSL
jgi:hypothetical protein